MQIWVNPIGSIWKYQSSGAPDHIFTKPIAI